MTAVAAPPSFLTGIDLQGDVNTSDETIFANIQHSVRLGYPQVKPQNLQPDRVCIVGGGPSLNDTFEELRELYFEGARIVALNGAAQWLLDRNIRPNGQIILDARPENARFITKPIPRCRYMIASQCHPDVWKAVEGRDVWIWHAIGPDEPTETFLNRFYNDMWMSVGHGPVGCTTVAFRGLAVLRAFGFCRFDLFGIDSCFMGNEHHAYAQPENDKDRRLTFGVSPVDRPDLKRTFHCAPWHLKQLDDMLQAIRETGDQYVLNIHGDGLLAYALQASAQLTFAPASVESNYKE